MPRRPAITPNVRLHTTLPPDISARLDLWLFSEAEGRVPKGAYQEFFVARTLEFFAEKTLDLAPFLGSAPGEFVVRAPVATLAALLARLKGETT